MDYFGEDVSSDEEQGENLDHLDDAPDVPAQAPAPKFVPKPYSPAELEDAYYSTTAGADAPDAEDLPEEVNLATDPKIVRGFKQLYRTHPPRRQGAGAGAPKRKNQSKNRRKEPEKQSSGGTVSDPESEIDVEEEGEEYDEYPDPDVNKRMGIQLAVMGAKSIMYALEVFSCSMGANISGFTADFDRVERANETLEEALEEVIPDDLLESMDDPCKRLAAIMVCLAAKKYAENTVIFNIESVSKVEQGEQVQQETQPQAIQQEAQEQQVERPSCLRPEPELLKMFTGQGGF